MQCPTCQRVWPAEFKACPICDVPLVTLTAEMAEGASRAIAQGAGVAVGGDLVGGDKVGGDKTTVGDVGPGAAVAAGAESTAVSGVAVGGDVSQSPIVIGGHNVVIVTYQGIEIPIPSPQAIANHRSALRKQLEKDAQARWGGMAVYIQEEGAALPIEASPYQTGRLGPRQNLLGLLHTADRLLVLGEPGSGKTVALERLAWELCGGDEPNVPVLVRLFQYDGKSLAEWVRAHLQQCGCLRLDDERALTAFLQEGAAHCVFLFDGLNEVPPSYRDTLVGELVRWTKAYPRHPVVLTSRSQDELWRRLRGEVSQAVVVQPIADEQARAYLIAHLDKRGEALYARLDQRLHEMARIPLILWLIKEAGAMDEAIPGNRGELYAHFISRLLRRDTDRRMDADIPERLKRGALTDLAYRLSLGKRLTCPCDEAVLVAAGQLGESEAEAVIGACRRHGLLAGEETVWFVPHQTVQEHFAALALQALAGREGRMGAWARLRHVGRRLLAGQDEGLTALAADDWWLESFVQLAGLSDDADQLARKVGRVNPWLAWWCVEEGRGVSEPTRRAIESRSAKLLYSRHVADRRRAVAALARIQSERAVRPLFRGAGDPDAEVAGIAVQALVQRGEMARALVAEALQGMDPRLWCAAIRYLVTQGDDPLCRQIPWEKWLGQPLVWVPPGPFWMGSDIQRDTQAFDEELPQHRVTLPGYWIGRYPVTSAQFRAFVQASDYEPPNERRAHGDDHPATLVTWRDALAYCRWLGEKTGLPVRLPSEAEWEKAARGTDGRIYPWGDELPDMSQYNSNSQIERTMPIGHYSPQGDSPYGCADMAGNVSEWTRSLWGRTSSELDFKYPYDLEDGREDLEAGDEVRRVLRGGSFSGYTGFVRCAFRFGGDLDFKSKYVGFRVCVAEW